MALPVAKFFDQGLLNEIESGRGPAGDLLLVVADRWLVSCTVLGQLRLRLGRPREQGENRPHFLWVIDFPLFEPEPGEKGYLSNHHPFTAPLEEDMPLLETRPAEVRSQAYDLVLNGVELGSGSARIYDRDIQQRLFKVLGLSDREAEENLASSWKPSNGAPPPGDRSRSRPAGDHAYRG